MGLRDAAARGRRLREEKDHATRGGAAVEPPPDDLRSDLADAMLGYGAEATRWVTPNRLWIRGPATSTTVSSENAADYSTARPIHLWIERLLTHDLPDVHLSAPIADVSVRFGFFTDGSFTVDDENEPDPSSEDDEDGPGSDPEFD